MIDDINEEVEADVTDTGAEETTTSATPGLGISDLRIFKQIIDICSSRGAFKVEEFTAIGESYEKLASFLAMIDAKEQGEEASDDTAESDDTDVSVEASDDTDVSVEASDDTAEEAEA